MNNIETKILQLKKEITDAKLLESDPHRTISNEEITRLTAELDELETKRKFQLDRRESWLPKTIWNLVVPIIVSLVTALITLYVKG